MTYSHQFVYHLVPKPLYGNVLYPLNRLKEIAPELAERFAQKYVGREHVMERRIPPLDGLLSDVLMFCPVHPRSIMDAFREEGFDLKAREWFQVPTNLLEPERTAVYYSRIRKFGDHTWDNDAFAMFAEVKFEEISQLPDALLQHIKIAKADARRPFMFVGVPHVLYKGELSLDGVEVISE